jgi:outer membrane protein assembly factor BamE
MIRSLIEFPVMMSCRYMLLLLLAALVFGALTGCYPGYRMDIEQGNVITTKQRAQLQLGMSRRETRFVLGSPLVKDPFHADRWDYVYSLRDGATGTFDQQRLSLFFEDNLLVDIRHNPSTITSKNIDSTAPEETGGGGLLQSLWTRLRVTK